MAYEKINFTNGTGEPINAENLNKIQEQYLQGILEAVAIKQSSEFPACVRIDVFDVSQALNGELYIVSNPNKEYDSTEDDAGLDVNGGTDEETETEEVEE